MTLSAAPISGSSPRITQLHTDSGTSFTPDTLPDATLPIFQAWDWQWECSGLCNPPLAGVGSLTGPQRHMLATSSPGNQTVQPHPDSCLEAAWLQQYPAHRCGLVSTPLQSHEQYYQYNNPQHNRTMVYCARFHKPKGELWVQVNTISNTNRSEYPHPRHLKLTGTISTVGLKAMLRSTKKVASHNFRPPTTNDQRKDHSNVELLLRSSRLWRYSELSTWLPTSRLSQTQH